MRHLVTKDLFALGRCVKKIGIRDELKKIVLDANTIEDVAGKGFDIFFAIFEAATEQGAEEEIYKFLSGPFEMPAAEIEVMELADLFAGVRDVADVEMWKDFFKRAAH